ncbi:MAG: hypothetical protein Q9163_003151 [Psora crenata]
MGEPNLEEIHDFLFDLALKAGDMITSANPATVDTKKNSSDLVTETDKAVEDMVSSSLRAKYPSFSFLGEETSNSGTLTPAPTFIVDPIDGTTNFVHGHPYTSISLAFAHKLVPLVGVVYNPFIQHIYHAIRGKGAWLTAPSIPTSHPPKPNTEQDNIKGVVSAYVKMKLPLRQPTAPLEGLDKCLVAVEWGNERSGHNWQIKTETFAALAGDASTGGRMVHSLRSLGSAALNCCAVARGDLDVYWEGGCWAWDVAAGWVVVEEAGGRVVGGNEGEWEVNVDRRRYLVVRGADGGQEELIKEFWGASFATQTELGSRAPDVDNRVVESNHELTNVVIDGPCFAHFIYHRLIAHKPANLGPLDAIPSYAEIGRSVIAFLAQLEDCGLNIDKIYFDGYLPGPKKGTRRQRLDQSLKGLNSFRSAHSTGFRVQGSQVSTSDDGTEQSNADLCRQLFSSSLAPATFRGLPSASFIVPATIDALSESHYAKNTEVVPGEADPYCALRIRDGGGIVLTADSDLIIYDLGIRGSVVFFDQLEIQASGAETPVRIKAPVFRPYEIAKRLGFDNLLMLGFQLEQHSSITLERAIQITAKFLESPGPPDTVRRYEVFEAVYKGIPSVGEAQNFQPELLGDFKARGRHLDPRFAELVLQLALKDKKNGACFYSWPLFEDPTRSPAWEIAHRERSIAYTCLATSHSSSNGQSRNLDEYARKGQRFVEKRSCFSNVDDRSRNLIMSFCDWLESARGFFGHIHECWPATYWQIVGVCRVLKWYNDNGLKQPAEDLVERAITGVSDGSWTWEDIHLSAQIQAMLYALRIIRQALDYIDIQPSNPHFSLLTDLSDQLSDLPASAVLMPTRLELEELSSTILDCSIMEVMESLSELTEQEDLLPEPLV